MDKADRERFEALIEAKKNKGGKNRPGHDDQDRAGRATDGKVKQTFSRRKV